MDFLKGRYALAIAIGAIFGALSRFYVTEGAKTIFGKDFGFYGTFFINVSGCLLMAYILTLAVENIRIISPELRLMTTTGFCGAYTTFSAYGLETNNFLAKGDITTMLIYWGGSAIAGLIGIQLGVLLARGSDRLTSEVSNFSHNPNHFFAKPQQGERIDLLERLLQEYSGDAEASSRTRLELLNQLGEAHQSIREFDKAKFYFQQAIDLSVEIDDKLNEAEALFNLGDVYFDSRGFKQARLLFQKSLNLKTQSGDRRNSAAIYHMLGMVAQELREYEEAQENYQQALSLFIEFADRYSQALIYHQLGIIAQELREYEEARQNYQQALAIKIEFGDRYSQASTYHQLGIVAQALREYGEARQNYQQAHAIFIEFGDRYSQALTYGQLGLLAEAENNFTEAGQNLLQALEIFAQFQDQHCVEMTLKNLSRIYQATQDDNLLQEISQVLGITIEEVQQKLEST